MLRCILLLFLFALVGCGYDHETHRGVIRNQNYTGGWTYVSLEPDGTITPILIVLCSYQPQLWKGEHVKISISASGSDSRGCWNLETYERVGPDE